MYWPTRCASRCAPLTLQDVDLDFVIDLALGDLPEAQRAQVQVCWQGSQRSGAGPGAARSMPGSISSRM